MPASRGLLGLIEESAAAAQAAERERSGSGSQLLNGSHERATAAIQCDELPHAGKFFTGELDAANTAFQRLCLKLRGRLLMAESPPR